MSIVQQRFWSKVDKTGDCWQWTAGCTPSGYGRVRIEQRDYQAHRVAYEWLIGPIGVGLQIDHLCRNRRCVNPAHMEPVTCAENLRRKDAALGLGRAKRECKRGHPFTPENTYVQVNSRGYVMRSCKTCRAMLQRLWQAKQKAGVAV